jgi:hypothetical protein
MTTIGRETSTIRSGLVSRYPKGCLSVTGPELTSMAVITNFNCLHKKYGEYVEAIRAQLALFEDSLRSRGIFCQVVDISDDATMSSIGAAAVPDISDEESTKKAIEATCEILNPAYITLIGGPDVVCHQNLTNPFYHPPYDVDEIIPSDLPYAAQSNYSPEISSHLSIVRAVGRIPDIPGAAEPSLLLAALKAAAMPIPSSDRIFGLSTDTWAVSTRLSIASLGRKFDLHLSPSEGPVWTDRQMRRNLHFINVTEVQFIRISLASLVMTMNPRPTLPI